MVDEAYESGDPQSFDEPIQPKRGCKLKVHFVEAADWVPKDEVLRLDPGVRRASANPQDLLEHPKFRALNLQLRVIDDNVETEHTEGRPAIITDRFPLQRYPYWSKKNQAIDWMNRFKLFQLEEAFGFEPVFLAEDGERLEARITRTGRKLAPKVAGVRRVLNPEFQGAYFDQDLRPKVDNWLDQDLTADVVLDPDEGFGERNSIARYVTAQS
jgi:hypothetical protein